MAEMEVKLKIADMDKTFSELQNKMGKVFGSLKMPSFGGGKDSGNFGAILNIGTKVLAAVSIVAVVAGALKDILQPILDQISLLVQILVLPFASLLNSLLRPVLGMAAKYLIRLMGPLKSSEDRRKLPEAGAAAKEGKETASGLMETVVNPAINVIGDGLQRAASVLDIFLPGFEDTFLRGMDFIGSWFAGLASKLGGAWTQLNLAWDWLMKMGQDILKLDFTAALKDFGMVLGGLGKALMGVISAMLQTLFLALGPLGMAIWTGVVEPLVNAAYNTLIGFGTYVWEEVVVPITTTAYNLLNGLGNWLKENLFDPIINFAVNQLKGALSVAQLIYDAISGLFNWAINWVKGLLGNLNPFGRGGGSFRIFDAVITPRGQVIQTDPADYLFATKNPEKLASGGSRSIVIGDININNPIVRDEADMRRMMAQFRRELTTILKRGGTYGI
jgi:hypothetical protein